jgi:hypothetical protein
MAKKRRLNMTDRFTPAGTRWEFGLFKGVILITTDAPDERFKIVGWTAAPFQAWICVVAEINLGIWKPGFKIAYELRRL